MMGVPGSENSRCKGPEAGKHKTLSKEREVSLGSSEESRAREADVGCPTARRAWQPMLGDLDLLCSRGPLGVLDQGVTLSGLCF